MCYNKWKKANAAAKKTPTTTRPQTTTKPVANTTSVTPASTPTTTPATTTAPTSISTQPNYVKGIIYNPADGSYSLSPDQLAQIVKQVEAEDQIRAMIRSIAEEDQQRAATEYVEVQEVFIVNISGYSINESNLTPQLEMALDLMIDNLRKYSDRLIICEGHTCNIGSDARNTVLGLERADAVRSYLLKKGFKPENVVATSKGASEPMVPNTSEANRVQNRRVVFIVK
jgi:outer membrane protein OmpA-like peptidoglycan-associated protein